METMLIRLLNDQTKRIDKINEELFIFHSKSQLLLLLGFIIVVAAYGSFTSNSKIILKQGGIAILTFVLIIVFGI